MVDIKIEEVKDFNLKLVDEIKILERRNLGRKSSINEWVIPVIIRYGKLIVAKNIETSRIIGVSELIRCWDNNKLAFIHSFYVDKKFRSKGIGKKLLLRIIEILRTEGIEIVELTISPKNNIGLNLYKKFGFKVEKVRKNEYGKGINRYLMRLKLKKD